MAGTASPDQVREAAARGVRLTPEQVAEVSRREQAADPQNRRTPGGPVSTTAQSILSKQEQLEDKMDELEATPLEEITEKDVGELHSAMTKERGGKPIGKDNIVSDLHRVAQANEEAVAGSIPVADMTKEDAAELQSAEARMSGTGRNTKGGVAAQAQSIADQKSQ
jgi:hypothetical protein